MIGYLPDLADDLADRDEPDDEDPHADDESAGDCDDDNTCTACDGCGEGQYDTTRCYVCKGKGTNP